MLEWGSLAPLVEIFGRFGKSSEKDFESFDLLILRILMRGSLLGQPTLEIGLRKKIVPGFGAKYVSNNVG